jgi:hypothetical protein
MLLLALITLMQATQIGERIYQNECSSKPQSLTHWNQGEDFASLGIGHFIWYTEKKDRFEETFPALITFLEANNASPPAWLKNPCPWPTRAAFYADIDSPKMTLLRTFLLETKDLQALFMARRLEAAIPPHLTTKFELIAKTPSGVYALVDYLNFKGLGTSPTERYNNKGWGLLQVLEQMPTATLSSFVATATTLLEERVRNSPPERNEAKWLPGWKNRLNTYKCRGSKGTKKNL